MNVLIDSTRLKGAGTFELRAVRGADARWHLSYEYGRYLALLGDANSSDTEDDVRSCSTALLNLPGRIWRTRGSGVSVSRMSDDVIEHEGRRYGCGTVERRRLYVGIAFYLGLLCAACRTADSSPEYELRSALNAAYPRGWRYATLSDYGQSELRPGERPTWVGGDFDGDGAADYAAQVVIFKPGHTLAVDSAQLVVALLRRASGLERHVLSVGGGPQDGIYLSRIPRGQVISDYEGRDTVSLKSDAVSQVFAGQASIAYVYDRGKWSEIVTGD
jgi:hypothetical protein